jgi:hypothetical protein
MFSAQLEKAQRLDPRRRGKAAAETELGVGSVIQDTTGSRYKVIGRYRDPRPGLDGYRGEALSGSKLTMAGSIYNVPYTIVDKVIRRVGQRPAPIREAKADYKDGFEIGQNDGLHSRPPNPSSGAWSADQGSFQKGYADGHALGRALKHASSMGFERVARGGERHGKYTLQRDNTRIEVTARGVATLLHKLPHVTMDMHFKERTSKAWTYVKYLRASSTAEAIERALKLWGKARR